MAIGQTCALVCNNMIQHMRPRAFRRILDPLETISEPHSVDVILVLKSEVQGPLYFVPQKQKVVVVVVFGMAVVMLHFW